KVMSRIHFATPHSSCLYATVLDIQTRDQAIELNRASWLLLDKLSERLKQMLVAPFGNVGAIGIATGNRRLQRQRGLMGWQSQIATLSSEYRLKFQGEAESIE